MAGSRALADHRVPIQDIQLHGFGGASSSGVGAAVYAVVKQESGTTQPLVAAKSRLAKQGLTIPRLELISGHMVTYLLLNVRAALEELPVTELNGWLDSTVALFWISGGDSTNSVWRIGCRRSVLSLRLRGGMSQHNKIQLILQAGVVMLSSLRFGGKVQRGWRIVNIGLHNTLSSILQQLQQD